MVFKFIPLESGVALLTCLTNKSNGSNLLGIIRLSQKKLYTSCPGLGDISSWRTLACQVRCLTILRLPPHWRATCGCFSQLSNSAHSSDHYHQDSRNVNEAGLTCLEQPSQQLNTTQWLLSMSHGTEEFLGQVLPELSTHKSIIDDKMIVVSHEIWGVVCYVARNDQNRTQ